ncbi:unnamed protein product [Lactuca saligna]|uniref:Arf-GAP domain-containing protein n=1 Tax=Lactuca saligna TaxID=75948 RepID=A0AA35UUV9_LACSI|nr:unnamed protein product [Lactuca saligna]
MSSCDCRVRQIDKMLGFKVNKDSYRYYLISKVIKVLPQEIETLRKPKWDAVLVSQYFSDLKEVKKHGRKERRNKEAQGVLATSTAVAAASSRISSFWKDTIKESAHYENKLKIKPLGGRSALQATKLAHVKCNYGHCQSTFHPTCGKSTGFFMNVERTKSETQKHGVEEWNSLNKVRVELERLRLICERIIRREKLKHELVICSHDMLRWNRESVCLSSSSIPPPPGWGLHWLCVTRLKPSSKDLMTELGHQILFFTSAKQKLAEFIFESGNMCCADCGTPDPKWVSISFGAFICIKCSRAHRSLGVHISKVLSVNLDELTHEALKQCPYAKYQPCISQQL